MNKKVIGVLLLVGILVLIGCYKSFNVVINYSVETMFTDKGFESFEFEDINGNIVTEDFFKNNKLTMINIWTYDSTSISDFQELYDGNADRGFNILGVIVDANSEDKKEAVREIVEKNGIKFTNIFVDEHNSDSVESKIELLNFKNINANDIFGAQRLTEFENLNPITVFVDSDGNIINKLMWGSKPLEEYQKVIDENL